MRVIGGKFRSRTLHAPAGLRLRPTSDALRQTLFDIVGPNLPGGSFVDAYAGTGAVGIEAASRGAARVLLIESSPAALKALRANIADLGISNANVLPKKVISALPLIEQWLRANATGPADFFFLDPPYAAQSEYDDLLSELSQRTAIVGARSAVIAEFARRQPLRSEYGELRVVRTVVHGDSGLAFLRRANVPSAE
jgi:16S rRNA (guanine966-N2)-methyltransferase